jgi:hypothetical protein
MTSRDATYPVSDPERYRVSRLKKFEYLTNP